MKYNVKIGEKTYTVEIEDIYARPVIARVDGEQFEVMPENGQPAKARAEQDRSARKESEEKKPEAESKPFNLTPVSASSPAPNPALSGNTLTAPLPGTVVELFIKNGDKVEAGQVLLVIEAMKMKNSIRSTWSGTVGEVFVSKGQTVAHKQALLKFAELGEAAWI